MLNFGAFAFLSPWLLTALALLPVIWWLLRITPPTPRRVIFPPIRLLFGLQPKEEEPAHTPLWLLLLRFGLAVLIIVALAHPVLDPGARLTGSGAVVLVVDDGWAAARHWEARKSALADLLDQAERESRPVLLLPTAAPASGEVLQASKLLPVPQARPLVAALQPKPWPTDRAAAVRALGNIALPANTESIWLTDGLDDDEDGAKALVERLQQFGPVQVFREDAPALSQALLPPTPGGNGFKLRALRADAGAAETIWVRAAADQGRTLAREPIAFPAGKTVAEAELNLPIELRNRLTRLEIEDEASAGAVVLLDERWRRRPVGLVSGGAPESEQPLLSDLYYLKRAITPFAEVREGPVAELLKRELAILVLSDIGQIVGPDRKLLQDWLQKGGVVVRFAGPRMAAHADDLLPVRLRAGGRALGGALSWDQPAHLAPFAEGSPFQGLAIPQDVVVNRQVLAEPSLDLSSRTWARLEDGTPLVTADKRGDGWLVLFHSTANTEWSNLPLSGLFVEMLQRIVELSQGVAGSGEGDANLPPLSLLDGFGRFAAPGGAAAPISAKDLAAIRPDPHHPPGFYGNDVARRAINLTAGMQVLKPLGSLPAGVAVRALGESRERDLLPWLLAAAIAIGILDLLIGLALRGLMVTRRGSAVGGLLLALLLQGGMSRDAAAQPADKDAFAIAASLEFRLAYVLTGNAQIDAMSKAGMIGLNEVLSRRTSVEGADPMAIDIERDEIVFFPLLYWPMAPEQAALSPKALAKVDSFMKSGGTILFDTRDQDLGAGFGAAQVGPGTQKLRQILTKLDTPPLVPVPPDHILTKAFYLMQEFPGRWAGGQLWVERYSSRPNDGVSSLVIGGNDWAAAWAVDADGKPIAAVVPGGAQQREMAFRFGINLVMYTLTGNYKADQVHVPALLERLGQ